MSSPPEVSWDDGGEGLVCTDMDAGVYFRRPGNKISQAEDEFLFFLYVYFGIEMAKN